MTCLTTFGYQKAIGHGVGMNASSLSFFDHNVPIKDYVQALKKEAADKEVSKEAAKEPKTPPSAPSASSSSALASSGKPSIPTLSSFANVVSAVVAVSTAAVTGAAGAAHGSSTSPRPLQTFTMESFKDMHEMAKLDNDVGVVLSAVSVAHAYAIAREQRKARGSFGSVSGSFISFAEGESGNASADKSAPVSPRQRRDSLTEKWQRSLSFTLIANAIDEKPTEKHHEKHTHKEDDKMDALQRTKALFAKAAAAALAARDGLTTSPSTGGATAAPVGGKTPTEYALKIFDKAKVVSARKVAQVLHEAAILATPAVQQCPFIVHLVGKFQTADSLVLVMEKATRRDLWTLMNDRRGEFSCSVES